MNDSIFDSKSQSFRTMDEFLVNVDDLDKDFVARLLKTIFQIMTSFNIVSTLDVTIDATNKEFYTLNYLLSEDTHIKHSMNQKIKDCGGVNVDDIYITLHKDEETNELIFRYIIKVFKYSSATRKTTGSSLKRRRID